MAKAKVTPEVTKVIKPGKVKITLSQDEANALYTLLKEMSGDGVLDSLYDALADIDNCTDVNHTVSIGKYNTIYIKAVK